MGPEGASPRPLLADEIVGRDIELASVRHALDRAVQGRGGVAFVAGEPGIGKSRMTRALAGEAAAQGAAVLKGRAVPGSSPLAYRPLSEALCGAVRSGIVSPDAATLGPFRPALAALIPEWAAEVSGWTGSSLAVAEGVLRFLAAAADGKGCLVVIDDLHWADPETLRIVEYLADNLAAEPVLCLVTVRDTEPSPGLELSRTLCRRRAADMIHLDRLRPADVDRMVAACLGTGRDAPDLTALTTRAEGVPFLVEELLAAAARSGVLVDGESGWAFAGTVEHVVPLTFADSVRRSLAELGAGRTVVAAAAVLGRRFDWSLLAAITHLPDDAVISALQSAVELQLVTPQGDSFSFRHALTRDAVLAELLPPERSHHARSALAAVEQAHPGLPGEWCELAADLAERAGDHTRAGELLRLAGQRAVDNGALGSAELVLERARSLVTGQLRAEVEARLAAVLGLAGKPDEAFAVGEALLARLEAGTGTARTRSAVHLGLARAAVAAGRWPDAAHQVICAGEASAAVDDPALHATIEVVAAQASVLTEPDHALERAQVALARAEEIGLSEVACEALEIIGRIQRGSDLDAAEASFGRAHSLAQHHGREMWEMRALHELGTIDMLRSGDVARLSQARDMAQCLGAVATTAVLDVQLGATLTMSDDSQVGLSSCQEAGRAARRHQLHQTLAAALAFESVAHARAGRSRDFDRCIAEALECGGDLPEVRYNTAWALAHRALLSDDRPGAVMTLARGRAMPGGGVGVQASGPTAGILALMLAVEGDTAAADALARPTPVHFLGAAFAHYARAVLSGRAGDPARALEEVAVGDDHLARFGWYRNLGHRHLAEAAIADGWGDPGPWLLDALAFFDNDRDHRLASSCRSLLRAACVPVPRKRSPPAARPEFQRLGITAREAEVLELLAHGLSNQEIGSRLYLSPRTVERHVSNLTDKTGASRRSELVAFAARVVAGSDAPAGV